MLIACVVAHLAVTIAIGLWAATQDDLLASDWEVV